MALLPPDPVFTLRCPEMGSVNSLCFHQGERLLAGTLKGNVFLWDLHTNRSLLNFEVGSQPITSLHHTKDTLITQQKGGTISFWSMTNSGYVHTRSIEAEHLGFCRTSMLAVDNGATQLLCYPTEESTIGVLHINDASVTPQLLVPEAKFGSVACLKPFECFAGTYLLAGYESGHFLTWDLNTGTIINMQDLEHPDPITLDYDVITNRGIVGGPTEKLAVIDYCREGMQLRRTSDIVIKNGGVNCIRIRGDQKILSSGGWDGRVRIFSWRSLRPLAVLTEHKTGSIMDIAHSETPVDMWHAPIMATGGMDGQISLWDLYK